MEIFKLEITPELYKKIPLEERVLFLTVGHFTNEIYALRKLICIASNTEESSEIGKHGVIMQQVMFVKALITKACEAYKFLKGEEEKKYFKSLKEDNEINVESHINNLRKYFESDYSRLRWLRNKLGAHYDADIIKKVAEGDLSDTHHLYLSEQQGNSLYFLSEEVLFKAISKDQVPEEAFPQLVDDVDEIAGWITDCAQDVMIYIGKRYAEAKWNLESDEGGEHIDIKSVNELSLPFFIDFTKKQSVNK